MDKVEGIERLRISSIEPNLLKNETIEFVSNSRTFVPHFHIPLQSGSNDILKKMKRRYLREVYTERVNRIREVMPNACIGVDVIVGFPGETDDDFEQTLALVRETRYAMAYSFKYSERPGTPAADRKDQIAEEVKNQRLYRLQALLIEQQQTFNRACVGRVLPVLVEKPGRQTGQMIGRSPYLQSVHLDLPGEFVGKIVDVTIVSSGSNSLAGLIA